MNNKDEKFVTRAGSKLSAALSKFNVNPLDMICADLGANVGGFTDCLLQQNAKKIYAVETGYGVLEYKIRQNEKVIVMERVNALHVKLPELCDLIVIDLGWTPQKRILPHARTLLKDDGQIISLVKPHYEAPKNLLKAGVLTAQDSEEIFKQVLAQIPEYGFTVIGQMQSPIIGAKGNHEYLIQLKKTFTSQISHSG